MMTTFPTHPTPAPSPELNAAATPGNDEEQHLNDATCINDLADIFDLLDSPVCGDSSGVDAALEVEAAVLDAEAKDASGLPSFATTAAAAASSPTFYETKASHGTSTSSDTRPSLCVPSNNPLKRRNAAALSPPHGAAAGAALKLQRVSSFGAAPVATKHEEHTVAAKPMVPMAPRAKADVEAASLRYAYYDGPRSAKREAILSKWKKVRAARVCAANMDAPRCLAKAAAALRKERDNGRFFVQRKPSATTAATAEMLWSTDFVALDHPYASSSSG